MAKNFPPSYRGFLKGPIQRSFSLLEKTTDRQIDCMNPPQSNVKYQLRNNETNFNPTMTNANPLLLTSGQVKTGTSLWSI